MRKALRTASFQNRSTVRLGTNIESTPRYRGGASWLLAPYGHGDCLPSIYERWRGHTQIDIKQAFFSERVSGFSLPIVAISSLSHNQPYGVPLSPSQYVYDWRRRGHYDGENVWIDAHTYMHITASAAASCSSRLCAFRYIRSAYDYGVRLLVALCCRFHMHNQLHRLWRAEGTGMVLSRCACGVVQLPFHSFTSLTPTITSFGILSVLSSWDTGRTGRR